MLALSFTCTSFSEGNGGSRPVSAPGVPQQLSEPKTPWQSSSGLAQQRLSQKPGPCVKLGMGMKTKTMMAVEQMWGPMPSVWLEGTHRARGKGKPVWPQQYCNWGVTSPSSPGSTSLSPALSPGRELPSLSVSHSPDLHLGHPSPAGDRGGWSPPYAHGAQPCLLQARGRQPQAPPPQHSSALVLSETTEPQGKLILQPSAPESQPHWLQGAWMETFSHFPPTAFTRAALFSFFTLPRCIEHSMQSPSYFNN